MVTTIKLSKKNERYVPYILEMIERYEIPNISRIILIESPKDNEDKGEVIIVIFTKNHLNSSFSEEISNTLKKELINFLGIDIFLVYISQDPNEKI
jgi:hypothetical protein